MHNRYRFFNHAFLKAGMNKIRNQPFSLPTFLRSEKRIDPDGAVLLSIGIGAATGAFVAPFVGYIGGYQTTGSANDKMEAALINAVVALPIGLMCGILVGAGASPIAFFAFNRPLPTAAVTAVATYITYKSTHLPLKTPHKHEQPDESYQKISRRY